jgi:hypothetical protein
MSYYFINLNLINGKEYIFMPYPITEKMRENKIKVVDNNGYMRETASEIFANTCVCTVTCQ